MKQTVEPPKMIHCDVYKPYIQRVPLIHRIALKKYMNIRSLDTTFNRNFISEKIFDQLVNFLEDLKEGAKTYVGKSEVYDPNQQKLFLHRLADLINSVDFEALNNKERNSIVEEQKRIYKQLN